jgi:general secretion pathway protein A
VLIAPKSAENSSEASTSMRALSAILSSQLSAPTTSPNRESPMYEEFYGFVQSPFTLAPDPRFLYLSETHDEAIREILQSIRRKEGFIVLTGDIGTGKTTLCRALLEQLDNTTFTSLVLNPFVSVEELLREILLDFGVVSREATRTGRLSSATKHELITTLHEFLLSLVPIQGNAVLIIDEAQHLSPQVLEQIRILSNLETNDAKLLQIVLVGQLNLLTVLAEAEMRQLNQRISLRATLKPLSRPELEAYISHRLAIASGMSLVTFDRSALDRVHLYSGGVPRVINLLCDRALMVGAQVGTTAITQDLIERSAKALALKRVVPGWQAPRIPKWLGVLLFLLVVIVVTLLLVPVDRYIPVTAATLPDAPRPRLPRPPVTATPTPEELGTAPGPVIPAPAVPPRAAPSGTP